MSEALSAIAQLPPDVVAEGSNLVARAKSVTILSDGDYVKAVEFINYVKGVEKRLDEDRVRLKAPFLAGTRQIDSYFAGPIGACVTAVKEVKTVMLAYDDRKRKEAEELARQAAAEQRRLAQEAQARAAAEAEARRQAQEAALAQERAARESAEASERAERARREAAEAQAAGVARGKEEAEARAKAAEEDAARAKAQAAQDREAAIEARRKQLRAEAQAQQAAEAAQAPVEAAPEPVKAAGVARKTVWKYRIKSRTNVPDSYLMPDEAKIQEVVDRLKDMAQESLGDWIEVYSEQVLAVGRGRQK